MEGSDDVKNKLDLELEVEKTKSASRLDEVDKLKQSIAQLNVIIFCFIG